MKQQTLAAAVAMVLAASATVPGAAFAQYRDSEPAQGARNSDWDAGDHYRPGHHRERELGPNDRVYRGRDGRYYCKRSDGTTGLVIGAIGGGVVGNAIGGDTLSTLLGAGGGALLGRSIDRSHVRCR
jgi:hypothetical protein